MTRSGDLLFFDLDLMNSGRVESGPGSESEYYVGYNYLVFWSTEVVLSSVFTTAVPERNSQYH